ncbi:endonuclease domain-containing protein (plasmid) [Microtetraspora malaysiensis]|uniref:endonuclease domain-containing protein n=1 Tax=Microtetraspora malaysiensis TaxID=161358 RepID=UPI003D8D42DD
MINTPPFPGFTYTPHPPPPKCNRLTTKGRPCSYTATTRWGTCAMHVDPADIERERQERAAAEPACWAWDVPADIQRRGETINTLPECDVAARHNAAVDLLHEWQAGRCAICGDPGGRMVLDHDHATGLIRGRLCRQCNTGEGKSGDGQFAKYRDRPPAVILGGFRAPYWDTFRGWAQPEHRPSVASLRAAVQRLSDPTDARQRET